jgi:hypothetical protein
VLWVYHFCHFLLSVKRLSACDFLAVYIWSFASMSHRLSKVPGKWRRKKTTACHPFCCSCRNSILWSITLLQLCVSNYLYVNSCELPSCSAILNWIFPKLYFLENELTWCVFFCKLSVRELETQLQVLILLPWFSFL